MPGAASVPIHPASSALCFRTRATSGMGDGSAGRVVRSVWLSPGDRMTETTRLENASKQPKRRRLWFNDRSCVRLRPAYRDHVWSYDFVHDRTHDGLAFRMLTLIDGYTQEGLAIDVSRRIISELVLERLSDLLVRKRCFGSHSIGQWAGVCSDQSPRVAGSSRLEDAVH